ncbi:indole-3-glycerol phosphate synthase TrpC [Oscillochloris sp. ZM17-4]|uniref:indole-3-glycerol phosphate synthase TrpC n=1 Tax=Oscillochloris sp. ZM17-4 TaxID=2866714 RepID=UPI00351D42D8
MSETFLTKILDHKAEEVARQRAKVPMAALEERIARAPAARDFAASLRRPGATALIAEVKKASPSRGVLIEAFDHLALARAYIGGGAAAISVLTDVRFFQGSLKYLEAIRQLPGAPPVLRKDFIIDPYQVYEARAYGADALLLIVAALDDAQLRDLLALTWELGMQALVEVHDEGELARALAIGAPVVGVNNRDLHSFQISLETTARLARLLPAGEGRPALVSESGIFTPAHVAQVRALGADAVLVGESLVTSPDILSQVRALATA